MKLYFNILTIPRTITREEWKRLWQWKRITEKDLQLQEEKKVNMLRRYGDVMPLETKSRMIDEMVNPPLLLGPYQ